MHSFALRSLVLVLAFTATSARPAGSAPHPRPSPSYNYCQADFLNPQEYTPLTGAELVKVQVVTRHGDRTSVSAFIPNDTMEWNCDDIAETSSAKLTGTVGSASIVDNVQHIEIPKKSAYAGTTWPGSCVAGQLTAKGARQHMEIGRAARAVYVKQLKFLPAQFDPKITYVRSSNVWRTRQSAASFLSTLYPKETRSSPLVINTYPAEFETLFSQPARCARVAKLNSDMEKDAKHTAVLDKNAELRSKFQRVLGTKGNSSFKDLLFPYMDAVIPRFCHNKPLPSKDGEAITAQDIVQMQQAINDEYGTLRGGLQQSLETNKLEIGLFMGELLDALDNGNKFELYSGHDLSIHGLLAVYQSKDMNWPPYASNLFIETWKKQSDGSKRVRIIYNGSPLKTDWCDFSEGCPLDTYTKRMRGLVPDYTKDC